MKISLRMYASGLAAFCYDAAGTLTCTEELLCHTDDKAVLAKFP